MSAVAITPPAAPAAPPSVSATPALPGSPAKPQDPIAQALSSLRAAGAREQERVAGLANAPAPAVLAPLEATPTPDAASPADPAVADANRAQVADPADAGAEDDDQSPLSLALKEAEGVIKNGRTVVPSDGQASPSSADPAPRVPTWVERSLGRTFSSASEAQAAIQEAIQRAQRADDLQRELDQARAALPEAAQNPLVQDLLGVVSSATTENAIRSIAKRLQAVADDPLERLPDGRYLMSDRDILATEIRSSVPDPVSDQDIEDLLSTKTETQIRIEASHARRKLADNRRKLLSEISAKARREAAADRQATSAESRERQAEVKAYLESAMRDLQQAPERASALEFAGNRVEKDLVEFARDLAMEDFQALADGEKDKFFAHCFHDEDGRLRTQDLLMAYMLFHRAVPEKVRTSLRTPFIPMKKLEREFEKRFVEKHMRGGAPAPAAEGSTPTLPAQETKPKPGFDPKTETLNILLPKMPAFSKQ